MAKNQLVAQEYMKFGLFLPWKVWCLEHYNRQHRCMKQAPKSKRHRISLPLKEPLLGRLSSKSLVYNSSSLIIMSSEENRTALTNRLNLTNTELFKINTKDRAHTYPSAFALIHDLPHVPARKVSLLHLEQVNFPVLMYKVKELIEFSTTLLLTSEYALGNFSQSTLSRLMETIALNYNDVAYHNFSHAFCLTLLAYQCLIKQKGLRSLFTSEEYFYILVAGFAHDLNHKGTNNSFEVKCMSTIAQQFHNQSVLENMHLQQLWKLLEDNPQFNFLLKTTDKNKAKDIITRLILSTDMAHHFKSLNALKQLREKTDNIEQVKTQNRWFMMEQVFHACDIGNPSLKFDNYISWAALLSYEFNEQAALEQSMNLEVTKAFIYHDLTTLYKDQVWFLGNLVHPLWKELSLSWPGLCEYVDGIEENLKRINNQLQKMRP